MKIIKLTLYFVFTFAVITQAHALRITNSQMDGYDAIIINPINNLTITEECNEITKKILYPTETTVNYNKIVPASTEKYELPAEVFVEQDKVYIENSILGKNEMGRLETMSAGEVVFTVINDKELKYDLGRKTLVMKKQCKYKIQNEKIYIMITDNVEELISINDQTIEELSGINGSLVEQIENLAADIGILINEQTRLSGLITEKELDWTNLLKEKSDILVEIETLAESVSNISTDSDATVLRAQIDEYSKQISNMDSEIARLQMEIDSLIKNYNDNLAELTAKTQTLASIINVSSEIELVKVMEQIIIPETSNKQKYNVKHLKGDIIPSKLIRVDE